MGKSLLSTLTVLLLSGTLMAGGFGIGEFGARSSALGNAVVAQAYDASTLFYNPARLGFLEGTQFYGGVTGIFAKASFIGASPVFDGTIHNAKDQFFPPVGIHITHQFSNKFAGGLSLTNPFGLGVAWEDDFPGRFISKDVTLQTFYLNPVVSYRVNTNLSVAVGAEIIFSNVNLQRNILLFNTDGVAGTGTEVGSVELDGAGDPVISFNAGLMYRTDKLGLGVSYMHSATTEFNEATADFTVFENVDAKAAAIANNLFVDQGGSAAIDIPNYVATGVYYKFAEKFGAEIGYAWYNWSVFEEIELKFDDERLNQTIPEDYENAYQIRFGAHYDMNENWQLRAGYIYDKTPQPIESVSPLLPDDTRNDYTFGFGYKTGKFSLDFGYMFVDIGKRSTVEDGVGKNDNGFNGVYNSRADLYMFSFGYQIR